MIYICSFDFVYWINLNWCYFYILDHLNRNYHTLSHYWSYMDGWMDGLRARPKQSKVDWLDPSSFTQIRAITFLPYAYHVTIFQLQVHWFWFCLCSIASNPSPYYIDHVSKMTLNIQVASIIKGTDHQSWVCCLFSVCLLHDITSRNIPLVIPTWAANH